VRLAESEALRGGGPVMLIDLELPAGAIGARLQLAGGPNVRVLLHDTGAPVSREAIARVAQRLHFALEVIPAPFMPSPLGYDEPDVRRLDDALDILTAAGYCVVAHLGDGAGDVAAAALRRSQTVYTVAGPEQSEAWQATLAAQGVAGERVMALADGPGKNLGRAPESLAGRPWASGRAGVAPALSLN
jgi:hypothetical protein